MGLFGNKNSENNEQILIQIIEIQAETLKVQSYTIAELLKAHSIKLILINKQTNQKIMSTTLASNQAIIGVLSLVDQVTGAPVTGTFSGTTAISDTPSVATTVVNPDGTITVSGVSAGSANIAISTTAAYTDSTGASQNAPLTLAVSVSVTQVVTADAVSLVVTFGPPQAQ